MIRVLSCCVRKWNFCYAYLRRCLWGLFWRTPRGPGASSSPSHEEPVLHLAHLLLSLAVVCVFAVRRLSHESCPNVSFQREARERALERKSYFTLGKRESGKIWGRGKGACNSAELLKAKDNIISLSLCCFSTCANDYSAFGACLSSRPFKTARCLSRPS